MIDLGRHAFDVLLAYGVTGLLIGGLIAWSVLAARTTRARLGEAEDER